jgi:hypothetical protein
LLANLKVVALVELDTESMSIEVKELYSKWAGRRGPEELTRWLRRGLLRSLLCVRSGWKKAMQEGHKRPAVRGIGVYGTWDVFEAKK